MTTPRMPSVDRPRPWVLVVIGGVLSQFLVVAIITVIVAVYASVLAARSGGRPDGAAIERVATSLGFWGGPALGIAAAFLASLWVASRVKSPRPSLGLGVGGIGSLTGTLASWLFSTEIDWLKLTGVVPYAIAGWYGARLGMRGLEHVDKIHRASRELSSAKDPTELLGELMNPWRRAEPQGVFLFEWRRDRWVLEHEVSEPPIEKKISLTLPRDIGRSVMPIAELPAEEPLTRGRWVMMSCHGSSDIATLLMLVTMRPISRSDARHFSTLGEQVMVVLDNLRLVEGARRAGIMDERQRLAHDIHDTVAQGFTSIIMNLEAAEPLLEKDQQGALRHLHFARRVARESLEEVRRVIWSLKPSSLEKGALSDVLPSLAERWSEETGIESEVAIVGTLPPRSAEPLSLNGEVALLRAAQEALNNVRRHARAGHVWLTLSYMEDRVVLDVRDDGEGFVVDAETEPEGIEGVGLPSMRQRIRELGGSLQVESSPGQGATIRVELPSSQSEGEKR